MLAPWHIYQHLPTKVLPRVVQTILDSSFGGSQAWLTSLELLQQGSTGPHRALGLLLVVHQLQEELPCLGAGFICLAEQTSPVRAPGRSFQVSWRFQWEIFGQPHKDNIKHGPSKPLVLLFHLQAATVSNSPSLDLGTSQWHPLICVFINGNSSIFWVTSIWELKGHSKWSWRPMKSEELFIRPSCQERPCFPGDQTALFCDSPVLFFRCLFIAFGRGVGGAKCKTNLSNHHFKIILKGTQLTKCSAVSVQLSALAHWGSRCPGSEGEMQSRTATCCNHFKASSVFQSRH